MLVEVIDISSESELKELFDLSKGLIVDLRNNKRFEKHHIKNALNIDLMSQYFIEFFTDVENDRAILVYCDDGSRSRIAVKVLGEIGYTNLFTLHNGLNSWDQKQ